MTDGFDPYPYLPPLWDLSWRPDPSATEVCVICTETISRSEDQRWVDVRGEQLCYPMRGTGPEAPKHTPGVK